MDKRNAIRFESVLNQNAVKVYIDGSKLDGRVCVGFLCRKPKQIPEKCIFPPLNTKHCVSGRSLCTIAILEVAKNLLLKKLLSQSIAVLVDSLVALAPT